MELFHSVLCYFCKEQESILDLFLMHVAYFFIRHNNSLCLFYDRMAYWDCCLITFLKNVSWVSDIFQCFFFLNLVNNNILCHHYCFEVSLCLGLCMLITQHTTFYFRNLRGTNNKLNPAVAPGL